MLDTVGHGLAERELEIDQGGLGHGVPAGPVLDPTADAPQLRRTGGMAQVQRPLGGRRTIGRRGRGAGRGAVGAVYAAPGHVAEVPRPGRCQTGRDGAATAGAWIGQSCVTGRASGYAVGMHGAESDVDADPRTAHSRDTGGDPDPRPPGADPDAPATTGTEENETFVGRVAGQDPELSGETGAEARAEAGERQ